MSASCEAQMHTMVQATDQIRNCCMHTMTAINDRKMHEKAHARSSSQNDHQTQLKIHESKIKFYHIAWQPLTSIKCIAWYRTSGQ